jgi:hypothetical protein
MYAPSGNATTSPGPAPGNSPTAPGNELTSHPAGMLRMSASRATLRTRPRIQRAVIRSWEYIPAVRVTILAIRLLVVVFMTFAGFELLTISTWWGLLTLVTAMAVLPFSLWLFSTAAKGWPVAGA